MEDQGEQIHSLIRHYRNGTATGDEVRALLHLIRSGEDTGYIESLIAGGLLDDIPEAMKTAPGMEKKMDELFVLIEKRRASQNREKPKIRTMPWIRYAAAILIFLSVGIGVYWYSQHAEPQTQLTSKYGDDALPGSDRATLTLVDGSIIDLDSAASGLLAEQSGIIITKTETGEITYEIKDKGQSSSAPAYNTISTPRGGQYKIVLPDLSCVWLNAASSLRYPTHFSGAERRVELSGEAYFQVTRNVQQAFIVESGGQETKVLGTEFNVNAYLKEESLTTLIEGSVQVSRGTEHIKLKPGQQSQWTGSRFNISNVNTESYAGWREGWFVFHDVSLKEIMPQLERWYDIKVDYSTLPDELYYGRVGRNVPLSQVLDMLQQGRDFTFSLKERRLMVKR